MTRQFEWHGGRLSAARAAYAQVTEPWLDLSTGINRAAWPCAGTVEIDWHGLPDVDALRRLEESAARFMGVDSINLCALPGSETGLRLIGRLLPLRGWHSTPCYRTHAEIFAGSRAMERGRITQQTGSALILANPNNPDGQVMPVAELAAMLEQTAALGGLLIVDEAFADAAPETSVASLVGDDRPLLVFRSFGKFFGLAGVRLGFMLGPRAIVARMRALLGDWPVSAAAIAIGTAAYSDEAWIAQARASLPARAAALDAVLARHGLQALGACPLFRLIEVDSAAALFDRLARRAILTRPFDYAPGWLRIGLHANDAELARLDAALRDG